jgi:hypothetical protein
LAYKGLAQDVNGLVLGREQPGVAEGENPSMPTSIIRTELLQAFPEARGVANRLAARVDGPGQTDGVLSEAELEETLALAREDEGVRRDLEALLGEDALEVIPDAAELADRVSTERAAQTVTEDELRADLEVLCKDPVIHLREASDPSYRAAAEWAAKQLEAIGAKPLGDRVGGKQTFLQDFTWEDRYARGTVSRSSNVVGVLPGTGPEPREAVVVIGHLDNLSAAEKRWYLESEGRDLSHYEGANDNAAAVASALEIARGLAQTGGHRRDVIFLLPSAEEEGLKGTEAFVKNPPVPLDRIVGAVNLEMIGANTLEEILLYGGATGQAARENPLYERAMKIGERSGVGLKAGLKNDDGEDWYRRSDHWVTAAAGIPSVMFHGRAIPNTYHQASDTLENLNLPKIKRVTQQALKVVRDLATDPDPRERLGPAAVSLNHFPGEVWPTGDR